MTDAQAAVLPGPGVGLERLESDTVGSNPALGMDVCSVYSSFTCHYIMYIVTEQMS
jgi:hypothetical protein